MILSVDFVESGTGFARLQPQWDQLWQSSDSATPFNSFTWCRAWWLTTAAKKDQLLIGVARLGQEVVGIIPFYRQRCRLKGVPAMRVARLFADEAVGSTYLSPIARPGTERWVWQAVIRELKHRDDIDAVLAKHLELGDPLSRFQLESTGRRRETGIDSDAECPVVNTDRSVDEFYDGLSKAKRKELRRKHRKLRGQGDLQLVSHTQADSISDAFARLVVLNRVRYEEAGIDGGFRHRKFTTFHSAALPKLAEQGLARIFELKLDGLVVASLYVLQSKSTWYAYQGGMANEFANFGPGALLDGLVIEEACRNSSISAFDFCQGTQRYKLSFATDVRKTVTLTLPLQGWKSVVCGANIWFKEHAQTMQFLS